jgi:hypothetical protein
MAGSNNERTNWDQARENVFYRLDQADRKSREQDAVLEEVCDRLTASETAIEVRDARTAWVSWVFAFLGSILGTVIAAYLVFKLGMK